ncbi:MAG: hypothetical protein ONB13_08810, partial [candidate division KSB1 bacterium]|nr:hypothetical protein [candidate division KSB1 bacterium]
MRAITLQKQLEDKSWTSLGATKLYEDFDYNYFTSLTNSTSLFAITAYEPPVVAQAAICGNKILEPGETYENCCADAGCPQGLSCISGQCREVTICGNNICESRETVESCPIDCVGKLFSPDAVTILILAVIAIIAILVFFGKKIFGKPAHAKLKRAHVSFNLER